MFCSNQILTVNGDSISNLKRTIQFILDIDEKQITDVRGICVKDGRLIFGWIPKERDKDNKPTGRFEHDYVMLWQTTLLNPLLPPTLDIITTIITTISTLIAILIFILSFILVFTIFSPSRHRSG